LERSHGRADLGLEIGSLCRPVCSNGFLGLNVRGIRRGVVPESVFMPFAPSEKLGRHCLAEPWNSTHSARLDISSRFDAIRS
jgi:hypothetical protein